MSKVSLGTACVNAGAPKAESGQPFRPGPQFASTYHLHGDINSGAYQYGRFGHPNWDELEAAIGQLEGGVAAVFPSGMSAAAAVMTALLEPGDTLLLPSDGYAPVRYYAESYLRKFGIHIRTIATADIANVDVSDVTLALLETPSNPMLDVFDIAALAERLHNSGGKLCIDNTTLTPLGQQPLALGADMLICSDTKAFNGHSDVVFGHFACQDAEALEKIKHWRKFTGNIPGPMETWLVQRSLATLDVRLERMCANAQLLAEALEQHPAVKQVRYPGLANDPAHAIAKQQQDYFGFIVSFELADQAAAEQFLQDLTLVYQATSFGGVHSMAERRARWGTDPISEGVIRFSAGCERSSDLLKDVANALNGLV